MWDLTFMTIFINYLLYSEWLLGNSALIGGIPLCHIALHEEQASLKVILKIPTFCVPFTPSSTTMMHWIYYNTTNKQLLYIGYPIIGVPWFPLTTKAVGFRLLALLIFLLAYVSPLVTCVSCRHDKTEVLCPLVVDPIFHLSTYSRMYVLHIRR